MNSMRFGEDLIWEMDYNGHWKTVRRTDDVILDRYYGKLTIREYEYLQWSKEYLQAVHTISIDGYLWVKGQGLYAPWLTIKAPVWMRDGFMYSIDNMLLANRPIPICSPALYSELTTYRDNRLRDL